MRISPGRIALWRTLRASSTLPGEGTTGTQLSDIPELSGWWDMGDPASALDVAGVPISGWNSAVASVVDKAGRSAALVPYSFGAAAGLPRFLQCFSKEEAGKAPE